MSGAQNWNTAFSEAAKVKPAKKPAPFSLRLTGAEKAKLLRRAKGQPLGGYIKGQLFNAKNDSITKSDAATVLAILGASELARNLACIATAAEIGALPVTPELTGQLEQACTDISRMRLALIRTLGLGPK